MNRNVVEDDCLQMVISTRRRLLATQNSGENEQTRMVLPLKKGVELIGILDILCDSSEIFTESTISLMEVLSNQLTVAIVNIQSMAETQIALEQVEALNRRLIRQQWAQTLKAKVTSGYVYTPQKSEPSVDEWLPGMELALHENQSSVSVLGEDVAIPLKLRGEVIGVLGLERDSGRLWDEDEILILQTIAEQISLALESARLFEDTQRNAWRDQVISESTAKVWASTQIEDVMKAAVAQLGTKLQASEVVIQLSSDYGVENS
jgi:GAF domain-containing protein